MIRAENAIKTARAMLGTPYSEMDCIALIRAVIRKSPGGAADYRCEGTNWLWRSIGNSGKYKHLTARQESTAGARAGMLAFKCSGEDVHHVGLVTGERTVIHSSSAKGMVVETPLTEQEGWHLLAVHRYIEAENVTAIGLPAADEAHADPVGEKGLKGETMLINNVDGYTIQLSGDWRVAED